MTSEECSSLVLPEGTSLYSHQVAGHKYDEKTKLGVLHHKNGSIIKPVEENDLRSSKELSFYESVFSDEKADPILIELRVFLPKFLGTCTSKIGDKELKFLCLEDVCAYFENPSILDVKVGKITYDPEASEHKIEYEKSKYLYSEILGFRILGMKVYCYDKNLYVFKDKKFGKQVIPDEMKNVLQLLLTSNAFINCIILCVYLHKLQNLSDWFKRQRKLAFISSSLLFVYEGNLTSWLQFIKKNLYSFCEFKNNLDETYDPSIVCLKNTLEDNLVNGTLCKSCLLQKSLCNKVNIECKLIRVVIIDCAHVFPTSEEDSNYLYGLESLIQYFQEILTDQKERIFPNK